MKLESPDLMTPPSAHTSSTSLALACLEAWVLFSIPGVEDGADADSEKKPEVKSDFPLEECVFDSIFGFRHVLNTMRDENITKSIRNRFR